MLTVTALPMFEDNYVWIIHNDRFAIAIDPGDPMPLHAFLSTHRLTLLAVLITHHHHDHTGGNNWLRQHYACPIYGPPNPRIPGITHPVHEPDVLHFAELELHLNVIDTPGHTLDHVSYYGAKYLFCGDTVFGCGCGKLFEGTPEIMAHSLDKILALPDDTELCCAHEYTLENIAFALSIDAKNPALRAREIADHSKRAQGLPTLPATLALEKTTNPFLRFHHPDMIAVAEAYRQTRLPHPAQVFGAIRAAKDAWDAG